MSAWRILFAFLLSAVLSQEAAAHGSVTPEGDLCIINVGFYQAHFKIYLPRSRGHREYCEDLPDAGEAVFIMEYIHGDLGAVPIDFRIIHNVTGMGRFANLEDVARIDNIEGVTVFYRPSTVQPDVFAAIHNFEGAGDYLGIVTARHPETDQVYSAVFAFRVGFTGFGYWPLFIVLGLLVQSIYWLLTRKTAFRHRRTTGPLTVRGGG